MQGIDTFIKNCFAGVDSVQLVFEKHTIYFLSSKTYIVIIMIINYMVEIYYGAPSELNSLLQGIFFV